MAVCLLQKVETDKAKAHKSNRIREGHNTQTHTGRKEDTKSNTHGSRHNVGHRKKREMTAARKNLLDEYADTIEGQRSREHH